MEEDTREFETKHQIDTPHLENTSEIVGTESDSNQISAKDECLNNSSNVNIKDKDATGKKKDVDNSNLHYEGEVCVYTDPVSKCQYTWDSQKNEWILRINKNEADDTNSAEKGKSNALHEPSTETSRGVEANYEFDGESYCYKDENTGINYKFDNSKNTWVAKEKDAETEEKDSEDSDEETKEKVVIKQDMTSGSYGYEGDTHTYTDAKDGTVYFWDREKNAWFPKVDDDFLAHYQMNYGFTNASTTAVINNANTIDKKENVDDTADLKRKAAPQPPTWFEMEDQHNTKVYVSNLPLDITEQEFVDVMQKCGMVMRDADTGKMKIKLYTEPGTNQLKGDGLCSYIKIESVDLALKLLDGSNVRGRKIRVERAKFQMKGDYDPNLKPKKRRKKEKEKLKKMQEKLFDWRPDKMRGERSKHERIVIIKNLFDPADFDKNVSLILEYQQDLREECSKCGEVKRVLLYDRHPEGVAQITFKEPEEADSCILLLNGRWFGKRKITAEIWDGKTKYKIAETDAETQQRLQKWSKFLEAEEAGSKKENKSATETEKNIDSAKKVSE